MADGAGTMAAMSLEQLNDLLKRAIASLQDDRITLVTYEHDPMRPLLPEGYWRDQHDRQAIVRHNAAADKAADLFERSLEIARKKMERRAEDDRLAHAAVDELLPDVPALWQPEPCISWGTTPMARSGGVVKPPTPGPQAPSYDFQCYQCGRPITERGANTWTDHSGKDWCDRVLMEDGCGWEWHQPKPWHGEEEDE